MEDASREQKYSKVVTLLRERIQKMETQYKEKSQLEQDQAVKRYQAAQEKVNKKIYATMRKQFPQNIRAVVQKAILSFRDGQIGRTEINALLKKHFSDSQFDNILLCVQGDLERCKKINLENWKKKADKQVEEMAEKAKVKARKERD